MNVFRERLARNNMLCFFLQTGSFCGLSFSGESIFIVIIPVIDLRDPVGDWRTQPANFMLRLIDIFLMRDQK